VVIGGYVALAKAAAAGTALAFDDPNGCVDPETRARLASTRRSRPRASPGR